ncbi:MAG: DNA cytosine methyltransferase [Rhodobacteraceae bacterium]|nr:DNA cytosine methyltransferase [Paracoccaceae bacterium]
MALESLKESIDLEHLATFGMEELGELRTELERLNSLAQLGIAVEIVGHELQSCDDIIGAGIRRLPEGIRQSDAVKDIELGYEGLTDQLRFLPLRLAGQKIQRWITEDEIYGGSRTDLPDMDQLACHQRLDGFKDVYGRMAWDKPAPTITGGCINPSRGRYIHPTEDRAITLSEAASLQGFPKSYKFDLSGGRYPAAQLIGNAFPPKFAEHHARAIYTHLEALSEAGN